MEVTQTERPQSYPPSQPQHQSLPPISSLTTQLPLPEPSPNHLRSVDQDIRDSGNWSLSQSKHSSGVSNATGLQLQTILNAEDSPSRVSGISVPDTPHSARASLQPTLPPVSQAFGDPRASADANSLLERESRRSSVDSRMNLGMNHLAISPPSPYTSENVSRVSLVSNLQQQRGITNIDQRTNGVGPLSPVGQRAVLRPQVQPRRAPVISTNPRSVSGMPDPTAPNPTKGYAWAFPDHRPEEPEGRRGSSSGDSSVERSVPSRQNSFAASINSSIFTTDSALPPGQKRFEDGDVPQTHHHSLQHRSVSNLQVSEGGVPGTGNYSRTPELRISHKMAERKRRSEMKNLFDELNGILPNSPGGKSSKWEILTKSIEHIKNLKYTGDVLRRDNDRMRGESDMARRCEEDNRLLRAEVHAMWQHLQRMEPGSPHVFGNLTSQLNHDQSQATNNHSGVLPPLSQTQWPAPAPAAPSTAMQGVEFASGQPYEHR